MPAVSCKHLGEGRCLVLASVPSPKQSLYCRIQDALGTSVPEDKRNYRSISLRVQVPNNHILAQNLYYNYYYPNSKYVIIGCMDPLDLALRGRGGRL